MRGQCGNDLTNATPRCDFLYATSPAGVRAEKQKFKNLQSGVVLTRLVRCGHSYYIYDVTCVSFALLMCLHMALIACFGGRIPWGGASACVARLCDCGLRSSRVVRKVCRECNISSIVPEKRSIHESNVADRRQRDACEWRTSAQIRFFYCGRGGNVR